VVGHPQVKSWNLSSIWRIGTDRGPVWLKEVPPFMAHEGAVLRWLDRPTTPVVLGADDRRTLLADIPGTDRFEADPAERRAMLADLLDIQTDAAGRLAELRALGVPAERGTHVQAEAAAALDRWVAGRCAEHRAVLTEFVGGLAERFAALESCGVPDTLQHGDFHPGNMRSDGRHRVLIDWGDCRIGHPVFDLIRLREWRGDDVAALTGQWCAHWRRVVPGCDPERAIELVEPVVTLRYAMIYDMFVRSIEPSERPYHELDVPDAIDSTIGRLLAG
jgi:hypothetical protein